MCSSDLEAAGVGWTALMAYYSGDNDEIERVYRHLTTLDTLFDTGGFSNARACALLGPADSDACNCCGDRMALFLRLPTSFRHPGRPATVAFPSARAIVLV